MKTVVIISLLLVWIAGILGTALGQGEEGPRKAAGGPQGHRRGGGREFGGEHRGSASHFGGERSMQRGPSHEGLIGHMLENPETAREMGLSDEQISTIRDGLDKLRQEQTELSKRMQLAAMEQAKLMTAPEIDEAALMAAIEGSGDLRTQMAKLRVKSMLLVRKHITPEQIEQIRQNVREKFQERMRQRRGEFGQGRGGPAGPEKGRGNWRPQKREGDEERRPQHPPRDDGIKETEREF